MKDFAAEFLNNKQQQNFADPHLYTTQEVREEILEMQSEAVSSITIANMIGIWLTAPLQTIVTSLQLSVKPHKKIYTEPESKTTQIAKLNTSLTLQEKRKMELMIRAGGQHKPYVAPVYDGYIGTIKGLSNQGPTAFYKGLLFRSIHQLAHLYALTEINLLATNKKSSSESTQALFQLIKVYLIQCVCDFSLNTFHIAENRYILQNNIPQFKVFRNGSRVIRKMYLRKQILTGAKYHLLNNIGQIFMRLPLILSLSSHTFNPMTAAVFYSAELLLYPFNTAFKRIVCQHSEIPGMIPIRYSSIGHAVRVIWSQEGILGLYRGFGLHQVATGLRLGVIFAFKPIIDKLCNISFSQ